MDRNLCLNWLNSEMDTPDKSKTVLENIIVALSLMDMDKADPVLNVYRYLLREIATPPGDESLRGNESKRILGLLPEILLRLSRMYDDQDTLYILLQQLIRFNPHFHLPSAEYKEDLLRLFTNEFSRTDHHNSSKGSPQSLCSSIEGWMCNAHVEEFDDIFQRIYVQFHNGTTPLTRKSYHLCRRILVLDASTSMNPEATLGLQLAIAMKRVPSITYRRITDLQWDWERGDDESLIVLIRHMMTADSDLRWPLYLPPQTIKYMCDKTDLFYRKLRGNQLWSDMFRSSRGIPELLHKQDLAAVWLGDAILLIWRGAMRAYQQGRLPGNWTPFVFYDFTVLQIMLGYYEHVTSKYYLGLDLSTLADYFEKALSVQHPGDGDPASQTQLVVQGQHDRIRIWHVLNKLGRAVDI
ncbi:hypothetical protein FRC02_007622 [Tulasnella sp. 418]|nr:hypothetical protein FRC02_007622 [Tulasnella sp. 418]